MSGPEVSTEEPEPDRVQTRAVIAALAISIAAIALSVGAVWLLLGAFLGGGEVNAIPATVEPPVIPFAIPTAGETHRDLIRAELGAWTRVDATHVRVPIGVAVDRAVEAPR
jgi:hypothetical protein